MKKFTYKALLLIIVVLLIQSCSRDKATNISAYNDTESHNMGQNCMNCHKPGGKGKGAFQAAGNVYDSLQTTIRTNGTVKLYTGSNGSGSVKATIQVDGNGNFFTTETIDFTGGLYPCITGSNGDVHYMPYSISMGQCNSCHGVNTNKIWLK